MSAVICKRCLLLAVAWLLATSVALCALPASADDDALLACFQRKHARGECGVGELFGRMYVKQRVEAAKKNLLLNAVPDMARFDRNIDSYVTELFYELYYTDYGVWELRRKSYNTSFKHGDGEIERAVDFLRMNPYDDCYMQGRIFSPLSSNYSKYYKYSSDTVSVGGDSVLYKLSFEGRFKNIRLLDGGWVLLDDSCNIREMSLRGWDEQSRFDAIYIMNVREGDCSVVESVHVDIDYAFLGNRLDISTDAVFDYDYVLPVNRAAAFRDNKDRYNLTGSSNVVWDSTVVTNRRQYAGEHRSIPLDEAEALLLGDGVVSQEDSMLVLDNKNDRNWMWRLGDEMISSHSYNWNGGGIRLSPLVNPAYVDYSSSRGLSYKLAMNVHSRLPGMREVKFKPQLGYNFKQHAVYWSVNGAFVYNPSRLGELSIALGEGNITYSSAALDRIKNVALDSLDFKNLNLNYFRNQYVELAHKCEIFNGFELLAGVNFNRRHLKGNADKLLDDHGFVLKKRYSQFAPHIRFNWQPGMYYYMDGGKKVNLGSRYPVFALDVEQGVNGVLGSNSVYTRSELDVQYKAATRGGNTLYMRFGAGGYFYTKDVYFVDYSFLKSNNLPVERSEELGGVFQLLDSEWYNAANKYVRANFTYESVYGSLQKLFPRVKLFQNEYIYCNVLFLSKLCPYMEVGYGVATPYLDMGLFISSQNAQLHKVGYKIAFSLFSDR